MQPEDQSGLHTGAKNPATFGNEDLQSPAVKAEIKKQREEANRLIPIAQTVLDFIDEERAKVNDFQSFLAATIKTNGKVTDDALTIEARAREMHLGFLNGLKTKITTRLNTAKKKSK